MKSFRAGAVSARFSLRRIGDTFAINTSDLKEPTQFLKLGDTIRGTKFKIVKFTEKS